MKIRLTDTTGGHAATLRLSLGPDIWWLEGAAGDAWWLARRVTAPPDRGRVLKRAGGAPALVLHPPLLNGAILTLEGLTNAFDGGGAQSGHARFHHEDGSPGGQSLTWVRMAAPRLSPLRQLVLGMVRRAVPRLEAGYGVTSRDARWSELTDATHGTIAEYLDAGPDFTSCNTVCGGIVRNVIRKTGRRDLSGTGMTGMQLDPHDITLGRVGGRPAGRIFVPREFGRLPRPGDFYSCPSQKYGTPHGHMGVVLRCTGQTLLTFDPGQDVRLPPILLPDLSGGLPGFEADGSPKTVTIRNSYGQALIKSRSMAEVAPHGWLDIDAWFYGRNDPFAPPGIGELRANSH